VAARARPKTAWRAKDRSRSVSSARPGATPERPRAPQVAGSRSSSRSCRALTYSAPSTSCPMPP
jgi:hypothetical protein